MPRAIAIVPAAIVTIWYGEKGTAQLLILSQVILGLQLPFAIVPLVMFTADHGDMLGERGLWYKMNFFEGASRIPLLVAGPGIARGIAPENVSLLDVVPTLLDLAGVERPDLLDGTVLVSLLIGGKLLGIPGAILAVPTAAILLLLFAEFTSQTDQDGRGEDGK